MIARMWRGWTALADAEAYAAYMLETGGKASNDTPGNRGFYILHRPDGKRAEFVTVSLWDSLEAVRGFAGDEVERAVFFPEDERYLVDREQTVTHWQVSERGLAPGA